MRSPRPCRAARRRHVAGVVNAEIGTAERERARDRVERSRRRHGAERARGRERAWSRGRWGTTAGRRCGVSGGRSRSSGPAAAHGDLDRVVERVGAGDDLHARAARPARRGGSPAARSAPAAPKSQPAGGVLAGARERADRPLRPAGVGAGAGGHEARAGRCRPGPCKPNLRTRRRHVRRAGFKSRAGARRGPPGS